MGEMADMVLDGESCQMCGEYMGGGDGFPRTCGACNGKSTTKYPNFYPIKSSSDVALLRSFLETSTYNATIEDQDKNGKPLFRVCQDWHPSNDYKLPDRVATVVCVNVKLTDEVRQIIKQFKKG